MECVAERGGGAKPTGMGRGGAEETERGTRTRTVTREESPPGLGMAFRFAGLVGGWVDGQMGGVVSGCVSGWHGGLGLGLGLTRGVGNGNVRLQVEGGVEDVFLRGPARLQFCLRDPRAVAVQHVVPERPDPNDAGPCGPGELKLVTEVVGAPCAVCVPCVCRATKGAPHARRARPAERGDHDHGPAVDVLEAAGLELAGRDGAVGCAEAVPPRRRHGARVVAVPRHRVALGQTRARGLTNPVPPPKAAWVSGRGNASASEF